MLPPSEAYFLLPFFGHRTPSFWSAAAGGPRPCDGAAAFLGNWGPGSGRRQQAGSAQIGSKLPRSKASSLDLRFQGLRPVIPEEPRTRGSQVRATGLMLEGQDTKQSS